MKILITKLYGDLKTTIPKEVRESLGIKAGDGIIYRFESDLTKIRSILAERGEIIILLPNKKESKKDRFKTL